MILSPRTTSISLLNQSLTLVNNKHEMARALKSRIYEKTLEKRLPLMALTFQCLVVRSQHFWDITAVSVWFLESADSSSGHASLTYFYHIFFLSLAGKTTTISMLTGALSPTEGTATICGNDIRTDLPKIRGNIGICLQHDCLFPKLTVREHVQFFSRVKGVYGKMSYADAEAGIDQTIRDVALEEKSNTFSMNLSGGMKRKLSLAMAFCGGSKVVFLDEPTSGMDPFSRRFSWNVIRQYRQGRCIVLTTHFMDEADILGDRIAIMAEGQLRCCGSSLFLKKTYGVGYQLTIEKQRKRKGECGPDGGIVDDSSIDNDIKEIVTGAVKDAVVLSNVGTEMSFQLPLGASDRMVSMFAGLEEQQRNGRITTYGVSITTLDEVFLLVARGDDHAKEDFKSSHFSSKNLANAPAGEEDDDTERSVKSKMDLENEGLFGTHVQALIRKRAANFKRDKKAWCCTTILPSVFVLFGLLLLKFVVPDQNLSPMPLNMDDYNIDVVQGPRNPIAFNSPGSTFSCNPGQCTTNLASINTFMAQTNESYYFCGGPALADINASCSIDESESIITNIVEAGASGIPGQVETITEVRTAGRLSIDSNLHSCALNNNSCDFPLHSPRISFSSNQKTYSKRHSMVLSSLTTK